MKKNRNNIIIAIVVGVLLLIIIWRFAKPLLELVFKDLNKNDGYIYDWLSSLIASIGFIIIVITLILQQRSILNTQIDSFTNFFDRYSTTFYITRGSAFNVMVKCILYPEYCEYVVSTFFVTEFNPNENLRNDIPISVLRKAYPEYSEKANPEKENTFKDDIQLKEFDDEERHRLEHLIDFYTLLSLKDNSDKLLKECNFFYDWYRPLFKFLFYLRKQEYETFDKEKKKNLIEPDFEGTIKRLDKIYNLHPNDSNIEIYLSNHPMIKSLITEQCKFNRENIEQKIIEFKNRFTKNNES